MSDHYVEIMWIVFVYGYFMSPQDNWNIKTKNNEHDLHIVITTNLFVFLCHTIIDVYNCKEFYSETAILLVGVVIHNKRGP